MDRRSFLFVCALVPPSIWVGGRGWLTVSTRFVAKVGGFCSFCGKPPTEVRAFAGVAGAATRICDHCVSTCVDFVDLEVGAARDQPALRRPIEERIDERLRRDQGQLTRDVKALPWPDDEKERLLKEILDMREGGTERAPSPGGTEFGCSFCTRSRREVRELVHGPRVVICDGCTYEAAGVMATIG